MPLTVTMAHDDARNYFTLSITASYYRYYDQPTTLYYVSAAVLDQSPIWAGIYTYRGSLNEALGYRSIAYPPTGPNGVTPYINATSLLYTSSEQHCYDTPPQLQLCSSLCNNGMATSKSDYDDRSGLCVVTVPSFGAAGVWESAANLVHSTAQRDLSQISFHWRDSTTGKQVDLGAVCHCINLRFVK